MRRVLAGITALIVSSCASPEPLPQSQPCRIGEFQGEYRMERNYLEGREGDRANAILAAGYNFGLLLRRFEPLLHALIKALLRTLFSAQAA